MRRLLLALPLVLAGPVGAGEYPMAAMPEHRIWQVTEIAGQAVPAGLEVTLTRLKEGLLGGSAGCNRFTLQMGENETRVFPGPMRTTRMMCAPEAMAFEQAFGRALEAVQGVQGTETDLTLTGALGEVLIRARHQP